MKAHRTWQDKNVEREIIHLLNEGNVVAGTSDTVIGLLAAPTQAGYDALNRIKGRSNKPYILLVADETQAAMFTDVLRKRPIKKITDSFWPGPLTLLVPAKKSVPAYLKSQEGAIALRVPLHAGLQRIAKKMGGIFSTSANLAQQAVPKTVNDLDPQLAQHVGLIIDDELPPAHHASTILDCTGDTITVIREGEYSKEQLQGYIK